MKPIPAEKAGILLAERPELLPAEKMRILAVSDVESKRYYDYYRKGALDGFDLIIACGDLRKTYLEFLVTMASCPLVYVHGNHDDAFDSNPPEGCICIDGKVYEQDGVRILGLGGSYRYRNGEHMFTEAGMRRRILKALPQILLHRGFDILVTHAPARHLNDFDTPPHRGFECFRTLMERFRPKYLIHGHIHINYGRDIPRVTVFGDTTVINACESYIVEI